MAPDLEQALDAYTVDRRAKFDAICRVIQNRSARSAGLQAEMQRLAAAKCSEDNAVTRLRAYLYASLLALGESKLETDLFKLRIQRNSQPSILVADVDTLPDWCVRVKTTREPDREAILAHGRQSGEPLPVGVSIEYGSHLRIS